MSDFEDRINEEFNERNGTFNAIGHMAAINQRNQQIAQQKEQAAAIRAQTVELEKRSRIEADRAKMESQRLEIERQRLRADETEREMRKQEALQLKQLRNLMADSFAMLERLERSRPSR